MAGRGGGGRPAPVRSRLTDCGGGAEGGMGERGEGATGEALGARALPPPGRQEQRGLALPSSIPKSAFVLAAGRTPPGRFTQAPAFLKIRSY